MASLPNNHVRMCYTGPDQAGQLARLHAECFPHYWEPQAFSDFFAVDGTQVLIIEADSGECVAMLVYRVQFEQADIITLAVHEAYRRQGLARALLDRAMVDMRAMGANTLFLDVEDGNDPAIALYEGLGFHQQRRRRLYYRQKDGSSTDALVMTKKFA